MWLTRWRPPAWVWDSRIITGVRGAAAELLTRRRTRNERRRLHAEAVTQGEDLLRRAAVHLRAEGGWRPLLVRKRKPGAPLRFHSIIHERLDLDVLTSALGIEADRFEVVPGGLLEEHRDIRGDSAASLVMPRPGDMMLLFDFEGSKVLRVHEQGFSHEYERVRRAFSAYVPSAGFEVLPGRQALRERLVAGPLLSDVAPEVRTQAAIEILARLPALSENHSLGACRGELDAVLERAEPMSDKGVTYGRISQWLGRAELVPTHSDLKPDNIILSEDGPVCIDFGGVCIRSAWYDGVKLAFRVGRLEGGQAALGGPLGTALEGFLRAVVPGEMPEDWRRLALVGFALYSDIGPQYVADPLSALGEWASRSTTAA